MKREALVGLDTSVVVRFLIGKPADQYVLAVAQLDAIRAQGKLAAVSDLVVAESYFALQHHFSVSKDDALRALDQFLSSPEIVSLGEAFDILRQGNLSRAKPGFVDRIIHAQYLRETCQMVSFEKAAAKLPGVIIP